MNKSIDSLAPLLKRDSPQPGESLPSFLERLRVLNGYAVQQTIYDMCRDTVPFKAAGDIPDAPIHSETYDVLSRLSQLPPSRLYETTIHRFETCLHIPDKVQQSIRLSSGEQVNVMKQAARLHHIRSSSQMAFCRLCLKAHAYHRTLWQPHMITVCLEHRCLLEDCCVHCHALQNIVSIVADKCAECERPLSEAAVIDVSKDVLSIGTSDVFTGWLGERASDTSQYGFPDCPPNVSYRFIDGLRRCLIDRIDVIDEAYLNVPTGWAYTLRSLKGTPTIAENHILYSTALKALRDWPNGFHAFLTVYDERKGDLHDTTLNEGFGLLYSVWLHQKWAADSFHFVREAFDAHLTSGRVFVPSAVKSNRHRKALLEDWEYLTVKDAMQKLGIGQDTLETLFTTGVLHEAFPRDHRPFRYRLVRRQEVEALKTTWGDGLTLTEASVALGLSETSVADLARDGHLDVLRTPQEGSAGWLLSRVSVETYGHEILTYARPLPSGTEDVSWIDLKRASQIVGPVGGNALTILERVASGKLPAYVSTTALATPGSLVFIESDITAAIEQIKAENGWYDAWDIAALLHLKRTVIDKWIAHGLLVPAMYSGLAVYFDRVAVQRFIDDHIFVEEAAQIMAIGTLVVQKWTRAGRLKAVSGPDIDGCHRWLFRRADVERLRPENRLTAPQAAKLMGIGEAQFLVWIKQGKVHPVSGPGIDGMGQFLFLRKQLLPSTDTYNHS